MRVRTYESYSLTTGVITRLDRYILFFIQGQMYSNKQIHYGQIASGTDASDV